MPRYLAPVFVASLVSLACSASSSPDPAPSGGSGGGSAQPTGGSGPIPTAGGPSQTAGTGQMSAGSPGIGGAPGTGGTGAVTGGTVGMSGGPAGGASVTAGTGAGGSPAPECIPDLTNLVNKGGWVCAKETPVAIQGGWYGYGDGTSCTVPAEVCATGACCMQGTTVVPDEMFTQWGCGIGLELNSTGGMTPVKSVYAGTAKCFDIELTGSSGKNLVRIGFTQGSDTTGKVSPFVEIPPFDNGYKGQVCFKDAICPDWAEKAGSCTKPVGDPGTPHDMQIQVSAGELTASPFNVCVSKLTPVTDTVNDGMTNSCMTAAGQGSISEQFGTAPVSCDGRTYMVQNNAWGINGFSPSGPHQTLSFGPGTKFKVAEQTGTGANGAPASYPSIFIGANSGRTTNDPALPKAVSALTAGTAKTSWTWAANGATGSYNASYDVWFSSGPGGDPNTDVPSGGFLMVWFYDPPDAQPIGMQQAGTANIAGRNWTVWYGNNSHNNAPCVSYVAQQTVNSLSFSLGDFIQDAVTRDYVKSSWYLTNVFAGFEIWSGGAGLETTDFAITP